MRKLPTTTVSKAWDNWIKSLQDHSPPALWTIYQCSRAAKAKQKSESHILVSDTQFEAGHNNSDTSLRWQVSDRSRIRTELWLPNPTFQSLNLFLSPCTVTLPQGVKATPCSQGRNSPGAHSHPGRSASGFPGASVLSGSQQNTSGKEQRQEEPPFRQTQTQPHPSSGSTEHAEQDIAKPTNSTYKKIYTFHREMQCQDKGEWP